jgi:hypothetical protein
MVCCVAVPPPEPKRVWLEHAISENGFGAYPLVGVKHEPEQLLVVSVGCQIHRASLLHLSPCLSHNPAVIIHGVFSAETLQLLLYRIA